MPTKLSLILQLALLVLPALSMSAATSEQDKTRVCRDFMFQQFRAQSSSQISPAYADAVASCMADTMLEDMLTAGCICDRDDEQTVGRCADKASQRVHMDNRMHFRAVHYHCVRMANRHRVER